LSGSTTRRLVKKLSRDIPTIRGQKVTWREDAIYPCTGFWRIRRAQLDVMSWTATAFNENGLCIWNGGCWETMTECLKADKLHIYGRHFDTISPDPESEIDE
jgi:hypothetical protein